MRTSTPATGGAASPECGLSNNPEVWFAPRGDEAVQVAKTICTECPLKDACLEVSLREGDVWGIWGAMLPHERLVITNERKMRRSA